MVINPEDIIDLTKHLKQDGRLKWDIPEGEWTILRMVRRSTGSNTRPAPAAGLGFESNKFDKQAIETHFEAYIDPLLERIGQRSKNRKSGFTALDADSWEMGAQNWTPAFARRSRNYEAMIPGSIFPPIRDVLLVAGRSRNGFCGIFA